MIKMEHSKGKLKVVYTGNVALGAGFEEDIGKSAYIHAFRMICNTADKRHEDYHVPKINANAKRLVKCWNEHDEIKGENEQQKATISTLERLALQGGAGHDAIVQKAVQLQTTLKAKNKIIDGLVEALEIDGDILFKWLKKAYEMGVKRDRFSDQQSECDLPCLDIDYVPKMIAELKQALKKAKVE